MLPCGTVFRGETGLVFHMGKEDSAGRGARGKAIRGHFPLCSTMQHKADFLKKGKLLMMWSDLITSGLPFHLKKPRRGEKWFV